MQRLELDQYESFSKQFKHDMSGILIYNQCQFISRGIIPAAAEVWADSPQNPNVVALLPTKLDPEGTRGPHHFWTKPDLDFAAFKTLMDTLPLAHADVFPIHQIEYYRTLPLVLWYFEEFEKFGNTCNNVSDHPLSTHCVPFIKTTTLEDFKELLPEGFYVDSLNLKDAQHVNDTWFYNRGSDSLGNVEFWIKYLPSICIRNPEGLCVANALCTDWGSVGLVYVDPDHRRLGFGAVLMRDCSQKIFQLDLGVPSHCHITTSNVPSMKLAARAGWNSANCDVMYTFHSPKI